MNKMTITEALAETKLIKSKIQAKKAFIADHGARLDIMPDPLANEGGSDKRIKEELQGITDLRKRLVDIRTAIARANIETKVCVGKLNMSIADWINWKREVSDEHKNFLSQAVEQMRQTRRKLEQSPQVAKNEDGSQRIIKPVYHLNEGDIQKELEELLTVIGELDGKLSLTNATTFVTIQ